MLSNNCASLTLKEKVAKVGRRRRSKEYKEVGQEGKVMPEAGRKGKRKDL